MLVYRFENEQGLGPWAGRGSDEYDKALRSRHRYHSCSDMPCLLDAAEEGSAAHKHYRTYGAVGMLFGFTSKAQLKRAFPSSVGRVAMGRVGVRLVVFEVPANAVLRGNAQCIFRMDKASRVGELDLKTLKPTQ